MSTCNKCNKPINWLTTAKGKNMPVDIDPIPVTIDGNKVVKAYQSHFTTCSASRKNDDFPIEPYKDVPATPPQMDDDLPF